MYELVNASHPDKISDRIAGAIVDLAYTKQKNPKVAAEVMIGHGECNIIIESSVDFTYDEIQPIVDRITSSRTELNLNVVPQDKHLAENQSEEIKCGDNGIFKGVPTSSEEKTLGFIVRDIYKRHPYDGKYIYNEKTKKLIACQSNVKTEEFREELKQYGIENIIVNPLGDWTGGLDVDAGITCRKLGSDMGRGVTGGGLHGKDISKADVSVNIYCYLLAQKLGHEVTAMCAIGDTELEIDGHMVPYKNITETAKAWIDEIGGFEKLGEWGLIANG